ncbi:MAG: MAPEG family protein [Cellvibrio sp.]|uniref:MAPEG family protein n=1 Tax=Cellvibrio sp. TaxID=1965322 RepID=UPI0031B26A6A
MKTAIIVLLCLCLMPYLLACVSGYYRQKQLGKVDNQNPRLQYTQLEGIGARAVAAQQNSWEALLIYSAALLAVVASGVIVEHLALAALIVLLARLLHALFYLTNLDKLRTLSFAIALAPCFYLFYMAIGYL